jgi:hypothetical protein
MVDAWISCTNGARGTTDHAARWGWSQEKKSEIFLRAPAAAFESEHG